jgi:hypothetical protein
MRTRWAARVGQFRRWAHRERFCTVPVKLYMKATCRIVIFTGSALAAARQLWAVLLCCGMALVTSSCASKENLPPRPGTHPHESASYDFRQTPTYRQLSGEDKEKLEAVIAISCSWLEPWRFIMPIMIACFLSRLMRWCQST